MPSPLTEPSWYEGGWWTAQLELEAIPISGGRTTWTHHKRCKTQYEYSKMKLLSVTADPGPMAYRAIDGVAPEKFWKTKKHSFQARTRGRGGSGHRIKEGERYKNPHSYLKLLSQLVQNILKPIDSYIVLLLIRSPSIKTLT